MLDWKTIKALFVDFKNEEEGANMIEYVLLVALIGLVVAAAIPALTTAISGAFGSAATQMG